MLLVGAGPERERLLRYAAELGLGDRVEIRAVPYAEMPAVFAAASCVVLGSLSIPLWEEQFGMVLAEAMAAGAPILASSSGAIPEVVGRARSSSRRATGSSSRGCSPRGRSPVRRAARRARSRARAAATRSRRRPDRLRDAYRESLGCCA